MIDPTPSHKIPAMKRAAILLALTMSFGALPTFAQTTTGHEFGFIFGAARRTVEEDADRIVEEFEGAYLNDEFSLDNSSFEIFYGLALEPSTILKLKAGRIETPVRRVTETRDAAGAVTSRTARDFAGEVQHLDAVIEYRFSEAFGSSALFGGLGMYRTSADGTDTETKYGYQVGVNANFPISRRYGVLLEGAYHWTRGQQNPRLLTVGAGLRFAF